MGTGDKLNTGCFIDCQIIKNMHIIILKYHDMKKLMTLPIFGNVAHVWWWWHNELSRKALDQGAILIKAEDQGEAS